MEQFLSDPNIRYPEIEAGLLRASSRIRRNAVEVLLQSSVSDVRLFGLRLAAKKKLLTLALANDIVECDRSPAARLAAVQHLVEGDCPVSFELFEKASRKRDDDLAETVSFASDLSLAVAVCAQLPDAELRNRVEWRSTYGPAAYEALGLRDSEWGRSNARRDLRDEFDRFKALQKATFIATLVGAISRESGPPTDEVRAAVTAVAEESWAPWVAEDRLGTYLLRLFQRAALRVLCAVGEQRDVAFARDLAGTGDPDLRREVLRMFERFGTSHDATTVLRLSTAMYLDPDRLAAAETAFRLAYKKDKLAVLDSLRSEPQLATWSVAKLSDLGAEGVAQAFQLLTAESAKVRRAAVDVVWDAVPEDRRESLLSYYMRYRHYYNVVVAVDRRLYTPSWLRSPLPPLT